MPVVRWQGIFVAAVTPMDREGRVRPQDVPWLLRWLAERGAQGALLLGTTGEGPSLSPEERRCVLQAAAQARQDLLEDFRLLAGTGTPSLEETVALTRMAFDLGLDGVVVLPPYYFHQADEEGLWTWFATLLRRAVPEDGAFFAYHFPKMTRLTFSMDFLARLKDAFPRRFVGLKDSSGDPDYAAALGERFGPDLWVFTGNDRLLLHALRHHAVGAITALANLATPLLRAAREAFRDGRRDEARRLQARLDALRDVLETFPTFPAAVKVLGAACLEWPRWGVKAPLRAPDAPWVHPSVQRFRDLMENGL